MDRKPRLLKSVKKNNALHLEHAPIREKKVLTRTEEIFKVITDVCEEHYLLTDSECGLSLIDDKNCVTEIDGTENGYLLKFRMELGRESALRQFAVRLSKRLNCQRRFFYKEDSVTYPGVSRPLSFLECAMILEDNRGKEPIDRSGEEDENDYILGFTKKSPVASEEEGKAYDGTQVDEEVDEMLEDEDVGELTDESYAEAENAFANFA